MRMLTKDTFSGINNLIVTMQHLSVVLILSLLGFGESELLSETTTSRATHFEYHAGRYPGQIDRIHKESKDSNGQVQGFYTFIDPKHQVRTVEYTADKDGFHPSLINFDDIVTYPRDSEAVQLAKERHYRLFERIVNRQNGPPQDTVAVGKAKEKHMELFNKIAQEHAAIAAQREAERAAVEATSIANDVPPEHVN